MKSFAEINEQEATNLLRNLSMYPGMCKEQILGLYPDKRKDMERVLKYLIDQCRAWEIEERYFTSPSGENELDQGMLAAVWVLIDFIEQVEFHSVGEYPAKIIFFANGQVYEIIHAGVGREALVATVMSTHSQVPSNYLILVDRPEQIAELNITNTCGYCTVSPTGEVQYYKKE